MAIEKIRTIGIMVLLCMVIVQPAYTEETPAPPAAVRDIYIGDVPDNPASGKKGTVSLDFENADLKNVLKAFSMQTGINFIASDVIENKKITVFLSNVTIESALASILEANGLQYERQAGNVYLIKPTGRGNITTITNVYKMKYLQVYKMAEAMGATGTTTGITIIGQPAIAEAGSVSSTAANTPSSTEGQAAGDNQVKNIIDILRSLMSKYGVIVADRRNNSLVITDIPDVFGPIEAVIKELDVEPYQIMIQAEIIETSLTALKRIGLEYGTETQLAQVTYTGTSSTAGGASNQAYPTIPVPFPLTENYIRDTYGTSMVAQQIFQYGTLRISDTQVVLKLLAMDSDTKYLSKPKIMTINNEPAIIKVSANTAIGTNNTSVSQTGQSISTAERAETGVILKVTPQVNKNGDIFMFIEPSVSRAVASTLSTAFMDPSYRTSASTVMVRDMETIVVAGLIQTNNFKTSRKVPILGDIPIIGEAFKSNYKKVEDTELLIFITPHVVKKRDAEYISPPPLTEREYMLEKALEKYSKGANGVEKDGGKGIFSTIFPKEAVLTRDEMMTKTLQKYSTSPNTVQHK